MKTSLLATVSCIVFFVSASALPAQELTQSIDNLHRNPGKKNQRAESDRERAGELERARATEERARLREKVAQLAQRAAALRGEGDFDTADEIDATIRELCREFDPRLIRANDLKRRASDSRLDGNVLDADMYDREAQRILNELKSEYGATSKTDNDQGSAMPRNAKTEDDTSELGRLREQVQQLASEVSRLTQQLVRQTQPLTQVEANK